ncbi:hypothetical protein GIB67_007240 [Kingdonia uniflora]|uniref:FAR1 domain-containing protein n=1 Tax=Kingdonia uniflora TaxID=39325 RepID=A0A7J7NX42_9MAGN|nr:hypothetical protein GIB67_007240 [Kingdonia uniflora]
MDDSVTENWTKVIVEESPERDEEERTRGVPFDYAECSTYPLFADPPYEGQHFETVEDARVYYEQYGKGQGFSTKKRNSTKRNKSKEVTRVKFCCSNSGLSKNIGIRPETSERDGSRRSSDKYGCKTTLNINWNKKLRKYVVTSFLDFHNHKLVSPHNHHRMKVNRFFPEVAINLTETFELHNILVSKVFPNTMHHLCLWYITHKFPEKIDHVYRVPSLFKQDIDLLMNDTYDPRDFDARALNTKEKFEFTILKLDEIESYLDHYIQPMTVLEPSEPATTSPFVESMMLTNSILDPLVVQTKSRAKLDHKRGGRWKEGDGGSAEKKKRTCTRCGVFGNHDRRTCPLLKMKVPETRGTHEQQQPRQQQHQGEEEPNHA